MTGPQEIKQWHPVPFPRLLQRRCEGYDALHCTAPPHGLSASQPGRHESHQLPVGVSRVVRAKGNGTSRPLHEIIRPAGALQVKHPITPAT
jgi:hypothetical protein